MKKEYSVRKEIRLKNYDYSQNGLYFITICTKDKIPYLCEIKGVPMSVGADIIRPIVYKTETGRIAEESINQICEHYEDVRVVKYCIMPDHIHLILEIMRDNIPTDSGRMQTGAETFISYYDIPTDSGRMISAPTISVIIGSFKRYVSKNSGIKIWQRSYYDHIIRNKKEFIEICRYIENNPLNWINNKFNQNEWK